MKKISIIISTQSKDSLFLGLVVGFIYLLTLLPGVGGFADTALFQFISKILGIGHAPGYPGYLLINNVFLTIFPLGSNAFKANLLSALFSTTAIIIFNLLLQKILIRRFIALSISLSFAFTYTLWSQSVMAEVYSLNILFLVSVLYFFIRWNQEQDARFFFLGCYLYALSFGNHLTTITIFPSLVWFVWKTKRQYFLQFKLLIVISIIILIGASQYLYLFIRSWSPSTPYLEISVDNLSMLWYHVSGGMFKDLMYPYGLRWIIFDRMPMLLRFVVVEMSVLIPFVIYGFFTEKIKLIRVFLIIFVFGIFSFVGGYHIADIYIYLLPIYLAFMISASAGLEKFSDWLHKIIPRWKESVFLVIPVFFLLSNYSRVDCSRKTAEAQKVQVVLDIVKSPCLIVCPDVSYATYFWYYIFTEPKKYKGIFILHAHNNENPMNLFSMPLYNITTYVCNNVPFYLPLQRCMIPKNLNTYLYQEFKNSDVYPLYRRNIKETEHQKIYYYRTVVQPYREILLNRGLRLTLITDSLYYVEPPINK